MFEKTIKTYLNKHGLTIKPQSVLVAVSGGMDSMALLSIVKDFNPYVIYFNHHKRDDVYKDLEILKTYCSLHNLTLFIENIYITTNNFQAEAHHIRQKKLIELAKLKNIQHVLTAHHADDQVETILMRLVRGSDIEGYKGLKTPLEIDSVVFHKPMLLLSKEDIKDYIDSKSIPYHNDSSNEEDLYFRNRLRHHIIPELKKENPRLTHAFYKFHTQLNHLTDSIQNNREILSRHAFINLNKHERLEYLKLLMLEKSLEPTFNILNVLDNLVMSKTSTSQLDLENNHQFVLLNTKFYIIKKENLQHKFYKPHENTYFIPNGKVSIFYDNALDKENTKLKVCYNKVALPLILRHRLPGDTLNYSYGSKKLKQLFIDLKIPRHERDRYVVLVDQHQTILWVENIYINQVIQSENTLYIHYEKD